MDSSNRTGTSASPRPSKASPKRAVGKSTVVSSQARPALRDPIRTKRRILGIAAEEFASRGFDGTRVDEIAKRSKVSKNLIYHYFENKDALFIAVLEGAYELLRARQEATQLEEGKPLESIRRLVIDSFQYWSQSNLIAYMDSANFHKAKHIKKSVAIQQAHSSLIIKIGDVLKRGAKDKIFRDDVDPIDLYISISALAYHFFSFQRTFSIIFRKDFTAESVIARRLKHVEDVILGYLQFRPDH
jgi:TetR/AcrR family transcriptional regulator